MEELALELEIACHAVRGVAADRQPDRLQMDADLMRPPRLEPHVEERMIAHRLSYLEPRDRLSRRRRVERMACAIASVTADRGLDPPRP